MTAAVEVFDEVFDVFPKMIVFDVDETLWPYWVDTHLSPPFKRQGNGNVVDGSGSVVRLFPETEKVLSGLRQIKPLQIAYASRTGQPTWMEQLAKEIHFDKAGVTMWDLPDYREVYPGSKLKHFRQLATQSGIPCSEMLFFDDEPYSNKEVTQLGVTFVDASGGISVDMLLDGLRRFAATSK